MAKQAREKVFSSLEYQIEHITPEIAAEYLATCAPNRALSKATVAKYTSAMARGQWGFSSISFSSDGRLNDGQHRLHAIIRSGISADFLVIRGNDDFHHMDAGKSRSPADVLHILGYKNTNVLSAITRGIIGMEMGLANWPGGSGGTQSRITVDDIVSRVQKEPTVLQNLAKEVSNVKELKALRLLMKSYGTAGWFVYAVRNSVNKNKQDLVRDFLETVSGRMPSIAGDPAITLYQRLTRTDEVTRRISRAERCALLIKAWNAYFNGEECNRLMWRPYGKNAEKFPRIAVDRKTAVAGYRTKSDSK